MKTIDNKNYYPMLVSEKALKDDSEQEFINKWKQYDNISEKLQKLLTSTEITFLIDAVAKKHNLNDLDAAELSRNIRKLFFRELSEEAFSREISKILGGDETNGKIIISAIKKLKVSNNPILIKKPELEKLTLQELLSRYPEVSNSLITSNFLKFPHSDKKMNPTLRNWLDLYDQEVSVKKQTNVERGKFLYSSLNCAKLNEKERKLISKILQSRDENTKLYVDKETHEIIDFEENSEDLNNYKALITKTKVFKSGVNKNKNTTEINLLKNLKGVQTSINKVSPQHFSKINPDYKSKLTNNISKKKNDTKIISKMSFSSGQTLSTEKKDDI